MARFWSILFLLVPVLGVGVFAVGPAMDMWLPEDSSADGYKIDHLFYFILWLTGAVFVGTEIALFWFMWKYNDERNTEPVKFTHGSHSLEVIWTIVPAATLLFIAIYQINAWAEVKLPSEQPMAPGPDVVLGTDDDVVKPPFAEVVGRQFEWRIRYPGDDGKLHTSDDLLDVNELHVPVDEVIVLRIKSEDVLHSFFLPNMRVKQDVVPGYQQHLWFTPIRRGRYDIVCAELCGWGHYKMKGRLFVQSREQFNAWYKDFRAEQTARTEKKPKPEGTTEDE